MDLFPLGFGLFVVDLFSDGILSVLSSWWMGMDGTSDGGDESARMRNIDCRIRVDRSSVLIPNDVEQGTRRRAGRDGGWRV